MSTVIHPSPSLTTNEEDIANRSIPFYEHDDFVAGPQRASLKGKEREMHSGASTPDASSSDQLEDVGYPPTNEEAAETRRIEEVHNPHSCRLSRNAECGLEPTTMGDHRTSKTEGRKRVVPKLQHAFVNVGRYQTSKSFVDESKSEESPTRRYWNAYRSPVFREH